MKLIVYLCSGCVLLYEWKLFIKKSGETRRSRNVATEDGWTTFSAFHQQFMQTVQTHATNLLSPERDMEKKNGSHTAKCLKNPRMSFIEKIVFVEFLQLAVLLIHQFTFLCPCDTSRYVCRQSRDFQRIPPDWTKLMSVI